MINPLNSVRSVITHRDLTNTTNPKSENPLYIPQCVIGRIPRRAAFSSLEKHAVVKIILYRYIIAEPHTHHAKEKETHELIFSWLSWLAVLLVGAYARRRRRRSRATWRPYSERGWQRHKALVSCVLLWYWTSVLRSIDTCQNRVYADQFHVAISRAQVYSSLRSHVFLKLTDDRLLVSDWIAGSCQVNLLKTGQDFSEAGFKFII